MWNSGLNGSWWWLWWIWYLYWQYWSSMYCSVCLHYMSIEYYKFNCRSLLKIAHSKGSVVSWKGMPKLLESDIRKIVYHKSYIYCFTNKVVTMNSTGNYGLHGCVISVQCTIVAMPVLLVNKLKPRFARFQLESPMPIALRAPSREYISRFALRLGFVCVVDWNMWKSVVRSPQRVPASTGYSQPCHSRLTEQWARPTPPTNFPDGRTAGLP